MSSRRDRVEELSLQRKSCFLSLPPSPLLLPSASVSVARMGCKALSRTRRDSGAGAEAAGAKKERERERAQQEEKKTSSSSKKKKGAANEKRAESRKQKTHPLHPACARSGRCLARVRASEARFCALERRRKKKESKENEGARSFFVKSSSHYCGCSPPSLHFFSLFRKTQAASSLFSPVSCSPLSSSRQCLEKYASRRELPKRERSKDARSILFY